MAQIKRPPQPKPLEEYPDPRKPNGAAHLEQKLQKGAWVKDATVDEIEDVDTPIQVTVHYEDTEKMYPTSAVSTLALDTHNGWIPLPYEESEDEPVIQIKLAKAVAAIRDPGPNRLFAVSMRDEHRDRPALRSTLVEQGYGDPEYVGRQRYWPKEDLSRGLVYSDCKGRELTASQIWELFSE